MHEKRTRIGIHEKIKWIGKHEWLPSILLHKCEVTYRDTAYLKTINLKVIIYFLCDL